MLRRLDTTVTVSNQDKAATFQHFSELNINKQIKENIEKCKYLKPTPVQQYTIPIAMGSSDLIVQANTGSGKTAAFAIPILDKVIREGPSKYSGQGPPTPLALVILPTRELCQQTIFNFYRLGHNTPVKCRLCYGGGQDTGKMIAQIRKGCDILLGCPGKLIDFYEKNVYSLQNCKYLVIDEADRCLDMGFEPQITHIIKNQGLPPDHQTLFFSATYPRSISNLVNRILRSDKIKIEVGNQQACNQIAQELMYCPESEKPSKLKQILLDRCNVTNKDGVASKAIVFVERKTKTAQVARILRSEGIECECLCGEMEQADRNKAIANFKNKASILVATDCAQRGLDIPNIALVINYDCPRQTEDYIHRVGRTGRVGNVGAAITFVNQDVPSTALNGIISEIEKCGQPVPSNIKQQMQSGRYERRAGTYSSRRDRREPLWEHKKVQSVQREIDVKVTGLSESEEEPRRNRVDDPEDNIWDE